MKVENYPNLNEFSETKLINQFPFIFHFRVKLARCLSDYKQ